MTTTNERIFLPGWMKVLLSIDMLNETRPLLRIARDIDMTYSHFMKIIRNLEDMKLISTEKRGRSILITLTKKGRSLQANVKAISEVI